MKSESTRYKQLDIRSYDSLREGIRPWPTIYVALDTSDLAIWYKIYVPRCGGSAKEVEAVMRCLVTVDHWDIEPNHEPRCTEMVGYHSLRGTSVEKAGVLVEVPA